MLTVTLACALLVTLCIYVHFFALKSLARIVHRDDSPVKRPLVLVLLVLFAVHLIEVLFYSVALTTLDWLELGSLQGSVAQGPGWFFDHFYFSIASYTTLGIGDIVPHGPLRLVVGIESLNGLVLVTWSASFTYLMMERVWGPGGSDRRSR